MRESIFYAISTRFRFNESFIIEASSKTINRHEKDNDNRWRAAQDNEYGCDG